MNPREIATPLTIGSFLLIAVTGVLMFFHLDSGLNKLAHEWLAWAMIAAVGWHVTLHFRAFARYFSHPRSRWLIGAFVLLLAATFVPLPAGGGKPPHVAAVNALLDAPIERVAALTGRETAQLLGQLDAAGIKGQTAGSLRAAAGPGRERQMQALKIALGTE